MKRYGIPDEEFIRGDVPMTKAEIRAMVMVKADIHPTDTVVDVGAGTGSISIEAATHASQGKVIAVERHAEGIELIRRNASKFGLANVEVIHGKAPDALADIPQADVVIIGGSGGNLAGILDEVERMLSKDGRLVVTAVTIETAQQVVAELKKRPFIYEGFQMQVNRLRKAGPYHLFQPISPIFIITALPK